MASFYRYNDDGKYFPFKVTAAEFKAKLYKHLLENTYLPDVFLDNLKLDFKKHYLPAYYFKYYYQTKIIGTKKVSKQRVGKDPQTGNPRPYTVVENENFTDSYRGNTVFFVSALRESEFTGLLLSVPYEQHFNLVIHNPDIHSVVEKHNITVQEVRLKRVEFALEQRVLRLAFAEAQKKHNNNVIGTGFISHVIDKQEQDMGSYYLPFWRFEYNYGDCLYFDLMDAVCGVPSFCKIEDESRKSAISRLRTKQYSVGLVLCLIVGFIYYEKIQTPNDDLSGILITLAVSFLVVIVIVETSVSSIQGKWKKSREEKLKDIFEVGKNVIPLPATR
jgi:hypothetical protein